MKNYISASNYNHTTISTTSGTANRDDEEDCDDYLEEAYSMLEVLGLDLITNSEEEQAKQDIEGESSTDTEDRRKIPNGLYFFPVNRNVMEEYFSKEPWK